MKALLPLLLMIIAGAGPAAAQALVPVRTIPPRTVVTASKIGNDICWATIRTFWE